MSRRACGACGGTFREPDDNNTPPVCPACGHVYPSFNVESLRPRGPATTETERQANLDAFLDSLGDDE